MKPVARRLSNLFERSIALLAVIVSLPTLLFVALFLRLNTDQPVLLTDRFVGRGGRPAQSYRFRTTGHGTPAFRLFAWLLRAYSIDELPGFWAVACGHCGLSDVVRLGARSS